MTVDHAPRLTSLSPGAGCACKLPLAKLEQLLAAILGEVVPGERGHVQVEPDRSA